MFSALHAETKCHKIQKFTTTKEHLYKHFISHNVTLTNSFNKHEVCPKGNENDIDKNPLIKKNHTIFLNHLQSMSHGTGHKDSSDAAILHISAGSLHV